MTSVIASLREFYAVAFGLALQFCVDYRLFGQWRRVFGHRISAWYMRAESHVRRVMTAGGHRQASKEAGN